MILLVLLLALALAPPVWGQAGSEGSLEGTVTDPSGAVVPGVSLTARNVNTSATYTTTTDSSGFFRFLVLPLGMYEVKAEHPGFAVLIQREVVVTVGAKISLPLSLRLAVQSQTVAVASETPLVEPTRTHVSSTVEGQLIGNLPVNGRNFNDFIALTPGVIRGPDGTPSFAGQFSLGLTLVDGLNDNNPIGGDTFVYLPYQFSLEVVQEFQVNTNSYSAELGRAANGIVSTATKSGSNEFHGTLFWYFRDKRLNATDLIRKINNQPKEPLHIHQFGTAVGGPIVKNKLFFFAGYDGQRRQVQNLVLLNLPAGFTLSPLPSVAALQQRALDYLAPRAVSYRQTFDEDASFVRIDWLLTPRQRLSVRGNNVRFRNDNGRADGPQNSLEHTGDNPVDNDALAVSLTSALSSGAVNIARFNYLHNKFEAKSNSINPQANVFEGGQLAVTIGRAVNDPARNFFHQFQGADTLSIGRGRHAFKLGADALWSRSTLSNAQNFSGNYRFLSLESFGSSLAGTPLLQPGETYLQAFSGEGTRGITVHPNSTEFAAFAQDEWRVRPNLTFSFGLRYDVQWLAKPRVKNASPALAAADLDTSFIPLDANNFAPRFGFAWSPLRSERLVVRGGYGLFYGWLRGGISGRSHFQNGVSLQSRTFTPGTPSAAFIPAYPNTICGPPDPSGSSPSCPSPIAGVDVIQMVSPDYVQPYDQHASVGVEYQLHKELALSASYLMVKGTHLQRWRDVNLLAPVPATIEVAGTNTLLSYQRFPGPTGSPTRPIDSFGRIFTMESNANSNYQGLAVQLNKRFSHNLRFLAAYTLAKVIDDRPGPFAFNPGSSVEAFLLTDPFHARADRAAGDLDARHRFVLHGIWDLNYAHALRGPAKAILGGWEFSWILAAQSGLPYSGLVNFDLNNDGNAFSDRTPSQPRNAFRLPTTVSFDPRLTRNLALTERVHLQVVWEAFNAFNRADITGVRTTQFSRSTSAAVCGIAGTPCLVPQDTGSTAFGTPTGTLGPRIMQFALKLLF